MRQSLLILCVFWTLPSLAWGQGRLQQVRQDVRGEEPPSDRNSNSKDDDDDDQGGFLGQLLGDLVAGVFSSDGPSSSDDAPPPPPRPRYRFLCFPYQAGYPGYMAPRRWLNQEDYDLWGDKLFVKLWQVRLTVEDSYDFRGNGVNRVGTSLLIDNANRWGFLTQWHNFQEHLPCGCWDTLTLGDINLTYRVVNEDWANLRVGLGARTLFDRYQTDWGGNLHVSSDFFPRRNWIVTGSCDVGWVGNADVIHLHGQVGYIWRNWEIFGGYDYQRIESVNIQGPLLGARLWF